MAFRALGYYKRTTPRERAQHNCHKAVEATRGMTAVFPLSVTAKAEDIAGYPPEWCNPQGVVAMKTTKQTFLTYSDSKYQMAITKQTRTNRLVNNSAKRMTSKSIIYAHIESVNRRRRSLAAFEPTVPLGRPNAEQGVCVDLLQENEKAANEALNGSSSLSENNTAPTDVSTLEQLLC